ncbi:MAG: hypothetical protein K2V38_20155, partial [Gemmataceae bacterium]|nr:hypothetical protein [Gemmataceae bacterium]
SGSKLTLAAALRRTFADMVTTHAEPEFREWFVRLYERWAGFNDRYFGGRLVPPHLGVGRTSPRQFVECRTTTDFGMPTQLLFRGGIMFGTDRVVRVPYPAEGTARFVDDLLLHATVKQFVLELHGTTEDTWSGYGPLFAAEANRIGAELGLPPVEPRRRKGRDVAGVASSWPWALRPDGYYRGHVRFDHLKTGGRRARPTAPPSAVGGFCAYLLFLATTGRNDRLIDTLGQAVDRAKEVRQPALAADERRPVDHSGMPLPLPAIDPGWLAWNGGCVRDMAEGVRHRRAFDVLPILADALQDAGCDDPVLLAHLRAHAEHTANCWALRLLCGESLG